MSLTRSRTSHIHALVVAALALALLAGCNSTQQRRPPPPKPHVVNPPEPPPPAEHRSSRTTPDSTLGGAPGEQAAPAAPGPSEDAAVMTEEDVSQPPPEDEPIMVEITDDPSAAQARQASESSQSQPAEQSAGSATPAGGQRELLQHMSEDAVDLTGATAPASGDLVGPEMRIGAQTQGEQVAKLDQELTRRLSDFDERMRRAREAAEAARREQEASAGASRGLPEGRGYRLEEPPNQRGAGGAAATGSGLGNTPDLSGSSAGDPGRAVAHAAPAGIPDGRDDDIVARQLREAASKESDPVLREKLWEEYKKYKAGL